MAVISAPLSATPSLGRSSWRDLDWGLLFLVLSISIWSCLTISSATRTRDEGFSGRPTTAIAATSSSAVTQVENGAQSTLGSSRGSQSSGISDVTKQLIWIMVGLSLLLALAFMDYQLLMHLQGWIYLLNIFSLLLVLALPDSIAPTINGAQSWIRLGPFALQPSEFAKFALIVSLAGFLAKRQERVREFPTLMYSLLFLAPPLLLILKQPDFGTSLAVLSIWFGMLFFGGARLWHLALVVIVGASAFGYAWKTDKLKPHQKARLAVFLNNNPTTKIDRDAGYQIKQSQIAIGSGQLAGQGWGQGMQNQAHYVPENTTDFIFTVVAEELGFVGASLLVLAYLGLLLRTCFIAMTTDNYFGALMAGGFTALLAFHTIVNLGMTMRVMPITGVPLPFFSYGGSSYLSFALCMGLLQSIVIRQKRTGTIS